jgi:Gpi18-like mannosyltransferase
LRPSILEEGKHERMIDSRTTENRKIIFVVLLSIFIQIAVALIPDTMGDLISYRDWTRALVQEGFVHAYLDSTILQNRGTSIIYPPVIPVLFWVTGQAIAFFNQTLLTNRYFLEVLLKMISVICNLFILWILWLEYRKDSDQTVLLALIAGYGLNAAVIFNTSYWGQTDSISSFLILAALYVQKKYGRGEISSALAAAAVMTKPTVWPIALLIGVAVLKSGGIRKAVAAILSASSVFLLLLLPFLLSSRFYDAIEALLVQIDASPYVSANAHNLWWIIQGGLPMINVNAKLIGPLSYKEAGILLSGSFIAITIWKFWNSRLPEALYIAAASIAFGFFMLSTHMHENHWFLLFPIFAMIAFKRSLFRKLFYLLSFVFFMNLILHDPYLNALTHDLIPGPVMDLHYQQGESPIAKTFEEEGKDYVLQERAGKITIVGYFLTLLNAQAAVLLFCTWLIFFYRDRSFDPILEEQSSAPLHILRSVIVVLIFVTVTSVQFMMKASRFL